MDGGRTESAAANESRRGTILTSISLSAEQGRRPGHDGRLTININMFAVESEGGADSNDS